MEIKTKFDIGQTVYVASDTNVHAIKIIKIEVYCDLQFINQIHQCYCGKMDNDIMLHFTDGDCFRTKEEAEKNWRK